MTRIRTFTATAFLAIAGLCLPLNGAQAGDVMTSEQLIAAL
jgi:hypothetical protein